jgi:putative membrane protein insertion efficiency factor
MDHYLPIGRSIPQGDDFIWHLGFDIFLVTTFLILFFTSFVYASPLKGPWCQDSPKRIPQNQIDHRFNPPRILVEVYRNYISPIDGKNCPMYPTCSEYSLMCFERHGLFIGWMMTCDRLFRCGRDELRLSPWITVNGEIRYYDPLENNDFWWYDGR